MANLQPSDAVGLTIVTINYNNKFGLERTIQSVDSQTVYPDQHIIIDGDSKDAANEIIDAYPACFRKSISEKDNGIYDAMNKGLAMCEYSHVMFLNSGDYLFGKEIINEIKAEIHKYDFIYGSIGIEKGPAITKITSPKLAQLRKGCINELPLHPAVAIEKRLYKTIGGFRTDYEIASDAIAIIEILKLAADIQIGKIDKIITVFDVSGVSTKNHRKAFLEKMNYLSKNHKADAIGTLLTLLCMKLRKHTRKTK